MREEPTSLKTVSSYMVDLVVNGGVAADFTGPCDTLDFWGGDAAATIGVTTGPSKIEKSSGPGKGTNS